MRAIFAVTLIVLAANFAGCADPSQATEIANLNRRVGNLETRLKALEGGGRAPTHGARPGGKPGAKGPGKAKAAKAGGGKAPAPAKAPSGPRAKLLLEGDAVKVMVGNGERRFAVPGPSPVGELKIAAQFEAGKAPVEAGTFTAEDTKTYAIVCVKETQTCTAEAR